MCLLAKEHVSSIAHFVTTMHMLAQYIANAYPGLGAMDSCQTETHIHTHMQTFCIYPLGISIIYPLGISIEHTHTHTHTRTDIHTNAQAQV